MTINVTTYIFVDTPGFDRLQKAVFENIANWPEATYAVPSAPPGKSYSHPWTDIKRLGYSLRAISMCAI